MLLLHDEREAEYEGNDPYDLPHPKSDSCPRCGAPIVEDVTRVEGPIRHCDWCFWRSTDVDEDEPELLLDLLSALKDEGSREQFLAALEDEELIA